MIRAVALLFMPLLAAAGPAGKARAPASAPDRGPRLGDWIKVGNESLIPNAAVDLYLKQKPEPGIYRHIRVTRGDRALPEAFYPARAFAAREQGDVFISLTVGADGRPVACRITKPSGMAALDEDGCRLALARTLFTPGLDDKGRRFGGTVEGRISYRLGIVALPALIADGGWSTPWRYPKPLQPITLGTLGIPDGVKLPWWISTLRAMLATDDQGSVTACLLTWPTSDDALDKRACDRLREQRFEPALDWKKSPVASVYEVVLPLPR